MFMDDTTLYEIINIQNHISGTEIGNTQAKMNRLIRFTEGERMELNFKKCKEMIIDFRRKKTVIPPIKVDGHEFEKVNSYKLLGLWIDDNLKWDTNTDHIVKKAAKRLFFLKKLRVTTHQKRLKGLLYLGDKINAGIWCRNLARKLKYGAIPGYRKNPEAYLTTHNMSGND